ncbi:MAG: protein kinase, partial [Chlorobiaceae bacterium]|nr:protein kinase [Chlorobiaceae bacterium]
MSLFKNLKSLFQKSRGPTITRIDPKSETPQGDDTALPGESQPKTPPVGRTIVRQASASETSRPVLPPQHEDPVSNAHTYGIGELIENRYRVEEVLSGSMGYVYIGNDSRQRMTFAIKQPKESMLADRDLFSRVLQEADAWARLGMHPNIAYCYFVKAIHEVPHIFIEYVDGGSLEEWISDRRCADYRRGLDMAIQFCHGMERAHERGMIHRDIKPRNILVTQDGQVKVTDFGLVGGGRATQRAALHQGLHGTRLGDTMGTPAYMAPEQWQDPRQQNADAPEGVWFDSDVYSFGVCMWEMFCGKRPREISIGATQAITDPRDLRKDIPEALRALLLRSVMSDRRKRQQDFREMREELNTVYRNLYGSDAPHYRLELHDTTADELNNQGYSYFELGNTAEARRCFEDAISADNSHSEAIYNLAIIQWRAGEIDDMEVLRKVRNCRNNPAADKGKIVEMLASIHAERGDQESAREELQEYAGRYETMFGNSLSGSSIGLIRTIEEQSEWGGEDWDVLQFVYVSAGGKYAVLGYYNTLKLWDLSTGQFLRTFVGHTDTVNSVSLSSDGKYALSGSS